MTILQITKFQLVLLKHQLNRTKIISNSLGSNYSSDIMDDKSINVVIYYNKGFLKWLSPRLVQLK